MSSSAELQQQFERIGIDNRVFQNLEREFQQVIQEMSGDASMERFKRKFERLHIALKESHSRESEYLKKCKELHDTIVNDTVGVETAIRFTQEDDNRMRALQRELEGIRKKLHAMKDLEEKNQEKIQSLKNAMKNMDESLKNSQSMTTGKANEINDWMTRRDELRAKRDDLQELKENLVKETTDLTETVNKESTKNENMGTELEGLREKVTDIESKINEDENRKQQQIQMEELRNNKKLVNKEKENDSQQRRKLKETITEFVSLPSPYPYLTFFLEKENYGTQSLEESTSPRNR